LIRPLPGGHTSYCRAKPDTENRVYYHFFVPCFILLWVNAGNMQSKIIKTGLPEIAALRDLFLQEINCQFIYNKCHQFSWADTYQIVINEKLAGYGAVWGKDNRQDRDAIFEFYLLPRYRAHASEIFPLFSAVCGALFVECQTNDPFLTAMLYEYCRDINAEAILFKEHFTTQLNIPGVIFRKQAAGDNLEGDDGWVLEKEGAIVATGGFVWNYNLPFIDMYYEVKPDWRKKGFGSFITQELKKEAYKMARVPAARCNINNRASKATLLKAGMQACGFIVTGSLVKKN